MRRNPSFLCRAVLPLLSTGLLLAACGGSEPPGGTPDQPEDGPQDGVVIPAPSEALTADLSAVDAEVIEVVEKAREAVRTAPENGQLWGELGMAYHANFMAFQSVDCYRYASLLQPTEPLWPHLEARAQADNGDTAAAIAAMEESVARDPKFWPSHRSLGDWYFSLGDLDEAHQAYLRALDAKPGDSGSRVGIAQIHLQRDEPAPALMILEEVAQLRPQDAYVNFILERAYRQGGHLMEAARQSVGTKSETPSWWDSRWDQAKAFQAQTFFVRRSAAIAMYADAHYDEALTLLDELYAENPGDPLVLNSLGLCYERLDRPEDAIRVAQECLAIDSKNRDSLVRAGSLIGRRGDTEEGLALLDRALALNPEDAGAHFARGSVLRHTEDLDAAIAAYRTSIGIDERNIGTWLAIARLEGRAGRFDRAAEAYLKAESVGLQRSDVYLGLARSYIELGRFDEAWKSLEKAVQFPPVDKGRWNNLRNELKRRTAPTKEGDDAPPEEGGADGNAGADGDEGSGG